MRSYSLLGLYAFVVLFSSAPAVAQESLPTVAESSDFQATSRSADVAKFVRELASSANHVNQLSFGKTVEGRELDALLIANPPVTEPEQLKNDSRLVALLLGNIHSGECAGKEALLALSRELTRQPEHPLLKHLVIIVLPNYNADGNDRVGKGHRSRQAGPAMGTGIRENVQALDLNRDFTKLDAPETRGLVRAMRRWNPHLFIDTHTTNGSYHRYDLTYAGPRNPAIDPRLREYVNGSFLPAVQSACSDKEVATFTYGNFNRDHTTWTTFGPEGRYSTEYVGLRGRIGILSEAYAYTPYKRRIESSDAFVRSCLEVLAENREAIRELLDDVAKENAKPKTNRKVSIQSKLANGGNGVVKGFEPETIDFDHYRETRLVKGDAKDHEVELFDQYESIKSADAPRAYLIPRSLPEIADRLLMHGVTVRQNLADRELSVRRRIAQTVKAGDTFQSRGLRTYAVEERDESMIVKRGDYIVSTEQPLGRLVVYLLEPECEDGLAKWGFFEGVENGDPMPVVALTNLGGLSTRTITRVQPTKRLTLDEIYGPEGRRNFSGSFPMGLKWSDDGEWFERPWGGRTMEANAATGELRRLRQPSSVRSNAIAKLDEVDQKKAEKLAEGATLSPQEDAILFTHEEDLFYLADGAEEPKRLTEADGAERFATFSPDGKRVGFVRDYTLYIVDVASGDEVKLTPDGSADKLYGQLDWVYQEEIYGRGKFKAFWWSPDSQRIAFLRLDEKPVGSYTVANNIPVRQTLEVTRYPKSGDPLPFAALGVVTIADRKIQWIEPESKKEDETLIVRVGWSPEGEQLVYQTQNRRQTELTLFVADPKTLASRQVLHEQEGSWVNVNGEPTWLDNNSFLWLSERTGHKHIYRVSLDSTDVQAITSGEWNVERLLGVDEDKKWIYYSGGPDWPRESHIYRTSTEGGPFQKLSDKPGNHSARFNKQFTHFFDFYSQAGQPTRVDLRQSDGKYLRTITPNLAERLKYYNLEEPEFMTVIARDGCALNGMMIRPPNFDPAKKYPVLLHVYSGPQAPTVRNRWSGSTYLWHQLLAQQGYIIWKCDNRSANGTAKDAWPIYGDLGSKELADIEDGLKWLKSQPYIDGGRIGIWGWSYGGYMTSYALTHSKSFKVGIAGAPVTDWHNYDAVYTERYMDLPQRNKKGYQTSSVVRAAQKLHGELLIVHGTIDDNVHLSNSLQLVDALQNARRRFELMLYPQNRHSVGRPNQTRHLRDLMTKFILDNL